MKINFNNKKILLIGADSFLGKGFVDYFQQLKIPFLGTCYKSNEHYINLDLKYPKLDTNIIREGLFSSAILLAGISNLAKCEEDNKLSTQINVFGTIDLLKQLKKLKIKPIFFSSDYVFNGIEGNYDEYCNTSPINEYGTHKAIIEEKIKEIFEDNFLIFRLSKVFGSFKDKNSFIEQMLIQMKQNQIIKALEDQQFSPIYYHDVLKCVLNLSSKNINGVFNLCGNELWTRYKIGENLIERFQISNSLIKKVKIEDLSLPYRLPKKLSLKNEKLRNFIDFELKSLNVYINKVIV
jgi:dTDP-4-dehydrorhamnose reductase